jgi:hypothetical protein
MDLKCVMCGLFVNKNTKGILHLKMVKTAFPNYSTNNMTGKVAKIKSILWRMDKESTPIYLLAQDGQIQASTLRTCKALLLIDSP